MASAPSQARQLVLQAREALRRGDRQTARHFAEQAAALTPHTEDPWLILAAVGSPRASVAYIQKALEINPDSDRARRGMQWALGRLQSEGAPPRSRRKALRPLFPALALIGGCLVLAWAAWSAGASPALASILSSVGAEAPFDGPLDRLGAALRAAPFDRPLDRLGAALRASPVAARHWAPAEVPKPTYTPTPTDTPTPTPTFTPTPTPTDTPTPTPTFTPTFTPSPTFTPEPTWTPRPTRPPATAAPYSPPPSGSGGSGARWIDVDLSQQRVYAYEGDVLVNSFVVSTGTWRTPTVKGQYRIYVKLRYTDMSGPDYYLPDVPHVMYFYRGYGFHGTYWHNNFGTPMSRGCVNLRLSDAEWLYNWASVGTLVNIHD